MTTESTAARFWDRMAKRYAAAKIHDQAGYERTLEAVVPLIDGASNVLEIGCGTGTTALRLAPHVRRLVATDVAPGMIAIARDKAAVAGVPHVTFHVAEASAPLADEGPFDAVLAFNLLHLIEDRQAVLRQVAAVLKPGGLFITKTACLGEMNPLIRLALPLMRAIGFAPPVAIFDAEALAQEIAAAGFVLRERGRHGSGRKDARIYLVAEKPALPLAVPAMAAAGIGA